MSVWMREMKKSIQNCSHKTKTKNPNIYIVAACNIINMECSCFNAYIYLNKNVFNNNRYKNTDTYARIEKS